MDTLQKKLLGWAGLALMVLVGVLIVVKTNQELNTAATTNTVSFSGKGKVLAKPDVGIVDLSIVTENATSRAAQDDNSKKSTAVTGALAKLGIAEKDIKTTGYNIYPQYDYTNGRSQLRGYQVNQTLQVKVRDLTKIDDVLAGVVTAGVNQVSQLQLTIDEPDKLKEQARTEAIEDARDKASALQKQLGIRLGRIVNFSEGSEGYVPQPIYLKADSVGRGGGVTPEIPAGENEISVDVTITYQIK